MIKQVAFALVALAGTGTAHAGTTYIVLPNPGSMAPATVYVDESRKGDRLFVCDSVNQIVAGTCRLHNRARR